MVGCTAGYYSAHLRIVPQILMLSRWVGGMSTLFGGFPNRKNIFSFPFFCCSVKCLADCISFFGRWRGAGYPPSTRIVESWPRERESRRSWSILNANSHESANERQVNQGGRLAYSKVMPSGAVSAGWARSGQMFPDWNRSWLLI